MVLQPAVARESLSESHPCFYRPKQRTCANDVFSGGVVACLNRGGDNDIHLCKPFWTWKPERIGNLAKIKGPISLELDKWRTRPSILLHELTHALFKSRCSFFATFFLLAFFAESTLQPLTKSGTPMGRKRYPTAMSTISNTRSIPRRVRVSTRIITRSSLRLLIIVVGMWGGLRRIRMKLLRVRIIEIDTIRWGYEGGKRNKGCS